MQQSQPIVINFKGGIVSPGYLKDILEIASDALVIDASFGLRQQLMIDIPVKKFKDFKEKCQDKNIIFYEADKALPNIVSSYCTSNIFTSESWLSEGVYKDVFDLFSYLPALKINICDSKQNLIPFFSGHLNWLSSTHSHFWQLSLRLPGASNIYNYPDFVYTNDIAKVSLAIEQLILGKHSVFKGEELFTLLKQKITYISKPVAEQLTLPVFHLPYYEGFNKEGETSWLGIYRRDQLFPVNFLKDLCNICLETKIGQFYTTSWKSIVIKGIHEKHKSLWDQVLGTYRINVRHAANELNWQIEDSNEDGLILKRYVIKHFDVEDVRTYGLSFVVKTKSSPGMFGSVVICKQQKKNNSRLKSLDRFEILYTSDFNPNSTDLVSFRKDVEKDQLGTYLVSLCKLYYNQLKTDVGGLSLNRKTAVHQLQETFSSKLLYQCRLCLSIYDESVGEPENNIAAGTVFTKLSATYACPLCESGKENFVEVSAGSLTVAG